MEEGSRWGSPGGPRWGNFGGLLGAFRGSPEAVRPKRRRKQSTPVSFRLHPCFLLQRASLESGRTPGGDWGKRRSRNLLHAAGFSPAAGPVPRYMGASGTGRRRENQLHAADFLTPPLLSPPSVRPENGGSMLTGRLKFKRKAVFEERDDDDDDRSQPSTLSRSSRSGTLLEASRSQFGALLGP